MKEASVSKNNQKKAGDYNVWLPLYIGIIEFDSPAIADCIADNSI